MDPIYRYLYSLQQSAPESGAYADQEYADQRTSNQNMMDMVQGLIGKREKAAEDYKLQSLAEWGVTGGRPNPMKSAPLQHEQGDLTTGDATLVNVMAKQQEAMTKRFDTMRKADAANQTRLIQEQMRGALALANTQAKNEGKEKQIKLQNSNRLSIAQIKSHDDNLKAASRMAASDLDRQARIQKYVLGQTVDVPSDDPMKPGVTKVPFSDVIADPLSHAPEVRNKVYDHLADMSDMVINQNGIDTMGVPLDMYQRSVSDKFYGPILQKIANLPGFLEMPFYKKIETLQNPRLLAALGIRNPGSINLPLLIIMAAKGRNRGMLMADYLGNKDQLDAQNNAIIAPPSGGLFDMFTGGSGQ